MHEVRAFVWSTPLPGSALANPVQNSICIFWLILTIKHVPSEEELFVWSTPFTGSALANPIQNSICIFWLILTIIHARSADFCLINPTSRIGVSQSCLHNRNKVHNHTTPRSQVRCLIVVAAAPTNKFYKPL